MTSEEQEFDSRQNCARCDFLPYLPATQRSKAYRLRVRRCQAPNVEHSVLMMCQNCIYTSCLKDREFETAVELHSAKTVHFLPVKVVTQTTASSPFLHFP